MRAVLVLMAVLCTRTATAEVNCKLVGSWKTGEGSTDGAIVGHAPVPAKAQHVPATKDELVDAAAEVLAMDGVPPTTIDRANGIVVGPVMGGAGLVYDCDGPDGFSVRATSFRRYALRVVVVGDQAWVSLDCHAATGSRYPEGEWIICAGNVQIGEVDADVMKLVAHGISSLADSKAMQRDIKRMDREKAERTRRKKP